jgi:hypothetical protein
MLQHIQLIRKRFSQLKKGPRNIMKAGFWCLIILTSASAILAVANMLAPKLDSEIPLLIQSLFTSGFYLWAELTVGALIIDYVFQ